MLFPKDRKFTFFDWFVHLGVGVNLIVCLYILYYVIKYVY